MQYGKRYKIRRISGEVIEGEYIQTKGDDENYPTFQRDDSTFIGVHHSAVIGLVDDVCPPKGIDRPNAG